VLTHHTDDTSYIRAYPVVIELKGEIGLLGEPAADVEQVGPVRQQTRSQT
jgi:hypothetical protein